MGTLEALVEEYGYWVILVGTFLEGETVLILGGFAAHLGYLEMPWVVLSAFAGTLAGDQFFFYLGRRHARETLARYPSWRARIERVHRLLQRFHKPLLLIFRFLYGLRSVIPFVIGLTRIPATQFLLFNIAGAAVWACAVGTGGYLFGSAMDLFLQDVQRYETVAMASVAVAGTAAWVAYFFRKRARRPRALQPAPRAEAPE